jgi:hypothetical protein
MVAVIYICIYIYIYIYIFYLIKPRHPFSLDPLYLLAHQRKRHKNYCTMGSTRTIHHQFLYHNECIKLELLLQMHAIKMNG